MLSRDNFRIQREKWRKKNVPEHGSRINDIGARTFCVYDTEDIIALSNANVTRTAPVFLRREQSTCAAVRFTVTVCVCLLQFIFAQKQCFSGCGSIRHRMRINTRRNPRVVIFAAIYHYLPRFIYRNRAFRNRSFRSKNIDYHFH